MSTAEYYREYYKRTLDKQQEKQRRYREKHREVLLERARNYERNRNNRISWSKKTYREYSDAHLVYMAIVEELRKRGIKFNTSN